MPSGLRARRRARLVLHIDKPSLRRLSPSVATKISRDQGRNRFRSAAGVSEERGPVTPIGLGASDYNLLVWMNVVLKLRGAWRLSHATDQRFGFFASPARAQRHAKVLHIRSNNGPFHTRDERGWPGFLDVRLSGLPTFGNARYRGCPLGSGTLMETDAVPAAKTKAELRQMLKRDEVRLN